MPLFTLRRSFDPPLRGEKIELTMATIISGATWYPNVEWERSYGIDHGTRQETVCVYRGPTKSEVARHSSYCGVPIDAIYEVEEFRPGSEMGILSRDISAFNTPPAEDDRYFVVERTFDQAMTEAEVGAAWMRSGQCAAEIPRLYWVRSYWSEADRKGWCVFRAPDAELVAKHSARTIIPCDWIEEAAENHPRDWARIYDSFNLPHHWEREGELAAVPAGVAQ